MEEGCKLSLVEGTDGGFEKAAVLGSEIGKSVGLPLRVLLGCAVGATVGTMKDGFADGTLLGPALDLKEGSSDRSVPGAFVGEVVLGINDGFSFVIDGIGEGWENGILLSGSAVSEEGKCDGMLFELVLGPLLGGALG